MSKFTRAAVAAALAAGLMTATSACITVNEGGAKTSTTAGSSAAASTTAAPGTAPSTPSAPGATSAGGGGNGGAAGLLAGVPAPPNATATGQNQLSGGGVQENFKTSTPPSGVVSFYEGALPQTGWKVTGSGGGGSSYGGGAGLQATNPPRYLSVNAGGPSGQTFVNVCVWPSKPANDNCGNNNDN